MKSLNKKSYAFRMIEAKWIKKESLRDNKDSTSNIDYYVLEMLPYPSGQLHMGHMRNYTIVDVMTRYLSFHSKVFRPFGWDSFGLPAENAAIEYKVHPRDWTENNIKEMKKDMQSIGFKINWEAEIRTCDVNYIKQQQKIFSLFYEKGLIYKKKDYVNWDPVDKTVLANEQVDENGRAWRSKAIVEKKQIEQWFVNITAYQEELLSSIDQLNWPEKIKIMQRNWIGKSMGGVLKFQFNDMEIECFSTCPHTIYGCVFIAISPESEMALKINQDKVEKYLKLDKQNLQFEDCCLGYANNSYNHLSIPIMLAEYVLKDYGTGVVIGVPSIDARDLEFAQKYPQIKCIDIVDKDNKMINSQELDGLDFEEAKKVMLSKIEQKTFFKLRDWCISRQRYWGCPIPIVYCPKCGEVLETNLPVNLPYDVSFNQGGNPLLTNKSWLNTTCPICGGEASRETDTMDTFFDSAWYFLRYLCFDNNDQPLDSRVRPVDIYVGGAEHAILHCLYARFFTKALRDVGLLSFDEPFKKLINQGMICHVSYQGKESGKYYYPEEVDMDDMTAFQGGEKIIEGSCTKMSKSLKNIIEPIKIIEDFGADTLKMFIISDTPITKDYEWNTNALFGCHKFLNKVWSLVNVMIDQEDWVIDDGKALLFNTQVDNEIYAINQALQTDCLNIYIAHIRILFNLIETHINILSKDFIYNAMQKFLIVFSPVCSFITAECYEMLFQELVYEAEWPTGTPINLSNYFKIVIQLDGKKQQELEINNQLSELEVVDMAMKEINLDQAQCQRYVYIKGKIINFVTHK